MDDMEELNCIFWEEVESIGRMSIEMKRHLALIIKEADKEISVVIMNKLDYIEKWRWTD